MNTQMRVIPNNDSNAAERDVRMSKLRWRASNARLDRWDLEGFHADRDGGEMRAWLVTPAELAVVSVSVLFDAATARTRMPTPRRGAASSG
jgi:hypothetical protein